MIQCGRTKLTTFSRGCAPSSLHEVLLTRVRARGTAFLSQSAEPSQAAG